MVKITLFMVSIIIITTAKPTDILGKRCLNCHKKEQIPSELIYRRYLMEYSSKEQIKEKMLEYLKNPKEDNSIMPKQFFLKFPMKKVLDINGTILEEGVDAYLKYFDIEKRLILPASSLSNLEYRFNKN